MKRRNLEKTTRLEVRAKLSRNRQRVHRRTAATAVGNRRATRDKTARLAPRLVTSARKNVTGHLFAGPRTLSAKSKKIMPFSEKSGRRETKTFGL